SLPVLAEAVLQPQNWEDVGTQIDLQAVLAADDAERRRLVESYIRNWLARTLNSSFNESANEQSLVSLGIDSLSGADLLRKVESDFRVVIPIISLLDQSIGQIVTRILGNLESGAYETVDQP